MCVDVSVYRHLNVHASYTHLNLTELLKQSPRLQLLYLSPTSLLAASQVHFITTVHIATQDKITPQNVFGLVIHRTVDMLQPQCREPVSEKTYCTRVRVYL